MSLPASVLCRLVSNNGNACAGVPQSTLDLSASPLAYYDDGQGDFDAASLIPIGNPITNWELRITYTDPSTGHPCSLTNQQFRMTNPPSDVATNPVGAYCGWVNNATSCSARQASVTLI
jgi:hypothetical protein